MMQNVLFSSMFIMHNILSKEETDMTEAFQELMYSAGVFRHYYGYAYLEQGVILAMEDPKRLQHICKEIYSQIARMNQTNIANVEKNIRTVRDVFVRNGGMELLMKRERYRFWEDKKPYPKEFIELLVDYFQG